MCFNKILLLLLLSCFSLTTFAQRGIQDRISSIGSMSNGPVEDNKTEKKPQSPDSTLVKYFTLNEQGSYTYHSLSYPLNGFQNFHYLKKPRLFYADLGNSGSAAQLLYFNLRNSYNLTFKPDVFEPYRLNNDSIRIFTGNGPFSQINYYMGAAKEQRLIFELGQRFGKGIYAGVTARYLSSPGIYLNQKNNFSGGTFYVTFLHPSNRYGAIATYKTDRFTSIENGGITDLSLFTKEKKRKMLGVSMDKSDNSDKGSGLVLQHYFNLQKQKKATVDSINPERSKKIRFDAGRLVHTFRYTRNRQLYNDQSVDIANYLKIYQDSTHISDSIFSTHIENIFVYSNETPDTAARVFPFQYSFGIRQQWDKIVTASNTTHLNQIVQFGSLKGIIAHKTYLTASAFVTVGGYNAGNYEMSGKLQQVIGKKGWNVYVKASKGLKQPDYFFNHYSSQCFRWESHFGKQDYIQGEAGIDLFGFDIKASFTRITNWVYLNKKITPQQLEKALAIYSLSAYKTLQLKHWVTEIDLRAQRYAPDTIMNFPLFMGRISSCYDVLLFKKALHAQIGLSATYHTSWKQDAYSPALRVFYLQDTYTAGNYPYLDAFVNLKVKRARMFIKYEHFNAGLFPGYRYIMVPGYPQPDAGVRFGVSWVFFD